MGLKDIVEQSGAELAGVGKKKKKAFQEGCKLLEENGVRLESLARVFSISNGKVEFV